MVQDAERKEKSENPPQLYDLTTLQRDANRLLGFTAQQTLNYAQSLYEKKLATYPRIDSRFLTGDMAAGLPELVNLCYMRLPFAKVPVQFEVKRILEVVVVVENLNAGEIIQARSVRLESMDAGKLQPGYLTDLSKVVGMQIRQAAPPGSVVFERSLTRPILVKQGEMIRIAARIGEIEVSAGGVAMSQGAAGDLIRVQNLTTKRFLTGRVQEDKSVLVLNYQGG